MDYDKQPINVDEQVALLQNRGLVIEDIATAKLQLRNISYFRIASYLRYMEEDRQFHHYKLGSTFEQAIDLYLFDKELRQLIFKAIQGNSRYRDFSSDQNDSDIFHGAWRILVYGCIIVQECRLL